MKVRCIDNSRINNRLIKGKEYDVYDQAMVGRRTMYLVYNEDNIKAFYFSERFNIVCKSSYEVDLI